MKIYDSESGSGGEQKAFNSNPSLPPDGKRLWFPA
jgi:hypothetical protein